MSSELKPSIKALTSWRCVRGLLLFFIMATGLQAKLIADESASGGIHPVASDVLFLVLGKMSIYLQQGDGSFKLRDHHFVAEIMPKTGRTILGGSLSSKANPAEKLEFQKEGIAWLAHGARVQQPEQLHQAHADGVYLFDYVTQSGEMKQQPLLIKKRANIDAMPDPARVSLYQSDKLLVDARVDPKQELRIEWDAMPGLGKAAGSELADLIFVLGFSCHGENVIHSGRPYQSDYLTYQDRHFTVAGDTLEPGLDYSLIVEQAAADVSSHQGVPGIATYATLTFVKFRTRGEAKPGRDCPVKNA